jgi:hypothetical protein
MKRKAPEPNTANPPRHLILAINADDAENLVPGENVRRFAFTPGLDDDWVFREFLAHIDDVLPSHADDEGESGYHLDALAYLCNNWKEERPPSSLPASLWLTPRAELGNWEKLEDHDHYSHTHQGPWLSVTELSVSFREHDDDEDERSTRQVDKQSWMDYVEDARIQEEKRKLREAKEKEKETANEKERIPK